MHRAGDRDGPGVFAWQGTPHTGTAHLPDGKTVPVGPLSFAAPETERDLLFAAAAAPGDARARALAGQALAQMKARRARWFTGPDEKWLGLDDVFLTMEGLGQWVAYWWFTSPQGLKIDPGVAQRELRRGGRRWTQDEGLALFLVVDRLVPGWQSRVFGTQAAMAEALLAAAAGR